MNIFQKLQAKKKTIKKNQPPTGTDRSEKMLANQLISQKKLGTTDVEDCGESSHVVGSAQVSEKPKLFTSKTHLIQEVGLGF